MTRLIRPLRRPARHLPRHAPRHALDRLGDDRGAQAAEYAMLGGVSAAACATLITILKEPSTLQRVVDAVVTVLARTVGSWF